MTTYILKVSALGLIAAAISVAPIRVSAADTNAPVITKPVHPKPKTTPFHGNLGAVDKIKMSITVGERTFQITSETKITRNGHPAILDDAVVGDKVGGAYKTTDDGKLVATTANFGDKVEVEKPAKKPKKKTDEAPLTTNAPAMTN